MSFKELLKLPFSRIDDSLRRPSRLTYDDLVNAESALGRTIFGPIPDGHQREFFMARSNVWIWHERYHGKGGGVQEMTIRYEVRPEGVFKRSTGGGYKRIEGGELDNFRRATKTYLELVKSKLYC
ncbi:hypothetical protein IKE98_03100 [Candidatus Saccharibacteria bacterium]|nr:hypothetical protein [Candidatus Saccharibacteria bacterium]